MNKNIVRAAFVFFALCLPPASLWAETAAATGTAANAGSTSSPADAAKKTTEAANAPAPYTDKEFPQWVLDLRRGEAIAFGALPFALFFSQFAVDTYRSSQHNWDRAYAPWPLKTAGAVSMTEEEYIRTFAAGCVGAVVIALVDFAIVSIKRSAQRKAVEERVKSDYSIERTGTPETPIPSPAAAGGGEPPTADGER